MKWIGGVPDVNDLDYFIKRFGAPSAVRPAPIGKGGKINPQCTRFYHSDGYISDVFHVKPVYYEALNGSWRPLSEVAYHFGNHKIILREDWEKKMTVGFCRWLMKRMELIGGSLMLPWNDVAKKLSFAREPDALHVMFTTTTVYPDPNPETTSVDGTANQSYTIGSGATFATIRAAAGNGSDPTSASIYPAGLFTDNVTNQYRNLYRSIFLFDTSSIGAGQTVSAAVLSLLGDGKGDDATAITPDINIVASTPASNTDIVNGDYTQLGATAFATAITFAGYSTSAYNDFTLNASGIAGVVVTGVSKFGARNDNYDRANSAPATWTSLTDHYFSCKFADVAGTTSDPKLVVTHASAGPSASRRSIIIA